MTDTGPLFVSSGDLSPTAATNGARPCLSAAILPAPPIFWRRPWNWPPASRPHGSRSAPSATGSATARGAIAAFDKARDADPRGLSRRPAPACPARRRRCRPGDERNLCAPAFRPIFRSLRRGADRAPRLSRTGTAARGDGQAMRTAGRPLHFGAMLDLGCGTGLAGAAFRPLVDRLVGVDLSPGMVAQAESKDHLRPSRHRRSHRLPEPRRGDNAAQYQISSLPPTFLSM